MEALVPNQIPRTYDDWVNLVHDITGGELAEEGEIVSSNEPLVRGVQTPEDLQNEFGKKINVRVLGDFDIGYTIRIRGHWPFSGSQLTYHVVPRGDEEVLLAAEKTRSKKFIFKPWKYEDDFTPAPKDESIDNIIPQLDDQQTEILSQVLKNTAVTSQEKGLNNPEGEF